METASPVRIVVLVESSPSTDGAVASGTSTAAYGAPDTLDALAQLGGDVEIEIVRDAETCLAASAGGVVDLVLVDRAPIAMSRPVLEALARTGPPVVVVTAESDEVPALEAFRSGASECVRVGPDYADVLPVVVLEQLRRSRKQREEGLAERRIRGLRRTNEKIIQNLNSALLVVDSDGVIVTANTTAEEILGVGGGELVGRSVWDWSDGEAPGESVIGRTLLEGVRFKGAETKIRLPDGTRIPIGVSSAPLELESDGVAAPSTGAVAVFQDLSEIRALQRQVMQTEKMASIGQLAAGVAHEINNPMGFIHANLFQMTEYLGDLRQAWERVEDLQKTIHNAGDGPDAIGAIRAASDALAAAGRELDLDFVQTDFAKAVRESQDGAERIRHIVKDLRDFSHQGSDECMEADVNQCLDSTASIAWTMMKHSVVLEKEYGDLPLVRCFPNQLKQVFMNLLVNAYQAIEQKLGDGGGTGRIELRTRLQDDGVAVSIRDTGTGIPSRDQVRIFDPFFTTKEVGAGTGLGLATSYNVARRHGGRIDVVSEPGEGSTFTVWLPLRGPEDD